MSETTVRTPSTQPQVSNPEQTTPQEEQQAAVPEQAQAAAEQAAKAEEQAREEAEQTRKAAIRAYRKGEREYRTGLLESGRLCDVYCLQRMQLGDKRAAAVQALEGELAKWSSTTVDVNRLTACYHAYRLLAEEPSVKAEAVPYGTYRDAWCQLVERHHKDTPLEQWALLPGMEQEARDLFAKATADGLSKAAVQEQVKGLLRTYADRQADEAAKAKAKAEVEAKAKAVEQEKARQEALEAQRKAQEAKQAVEEAREEEKARLTEAAQLAEEEQRAKHQAAIQAQAEAEQAAREQACAEQTAKVAEEAKRRAEEKARKAQERGQQRQQKASNVLPTDKGDAAAMAALAAEYITECDTPDDVLHALLLRLKASEELSARSKRAIDAALVVLTRQERPQPSPNGRAVAAA